MIVQQPLHQADEEYSQPAIPPNNEQRIINGEEVIPHSFPWQVSIKGKEAEHYCGASLRSPNWILTPANCAEIVFIGTYGDVVVVGQHDRRDEGEEGNGTYCFPTLSS